MGCCRDAPSWLTARSPMATKTATMSSCSPSLRFFKPMAIFRCTTNGPIHSSSPPSSLGGSNSRRWCNPLRRTRLGHPPDIIRHWVEAEANHSLPSQERVMVVSYNILGDRNAFKHRDLYENVPSIYLKWNHRKRIICEELIGWNPDIICLQEVDRYFDISNIMETAGYVGSYKRRTGDTVDGCAMFWKADKFQLLEVESIEFKQYGLRDNVAQLCVFEESCGGVEESLMRQMLKNDSKRLLVGNIHVLYNPRRGDVKLGQVRFLSSRAHILSKKWANAPVVLAGDYNSIPQSAIYKFLSSSELNIMLHDRRDLSGQRSCRPSKVLGVKREKGILFVWMDRFFKYCWTDEEVKIATGCTECRIVMHPLKLNSSYATVKGSTRTRGSDGEPLATSYHSKFLGTVDYLWYSDGLVPTRVLDTITIDVLGKTGGLPYEKLGSDHLALVSEFAFVQGTNKDYENNGMASTMVSLVPEEEDDSLA